MKVSLVQRSSDECFWVKDQFGVCKCFRIGILVESGLSLLVETSQGHKVI